MYRLLSFLLILSLWTTSCSKENIETIEPGQWAQMSKQDIEKKIPELKDLTPSELEQVVSKLNQNPNVASAFMAGERTFAIQMKGETQVGVVLTSELPNYFPSDKEVNTPHAVQTRSSSFSRVGSNGKIAVFNLFSNVAARKSQNALLEALMSNFSDHGYGVEYYPYEEFSTENLSSVVRRADEYRVVIVMSDGFRLPRSSGGYVKIGTYYPSFILTGEKYVKTPGLTEEEGPPLPSDFHQWYDLSAYWNKQKNRVYPVSRLRGNASTIFYIGSCDAFMQDFVGTYSEDAYSRLRSADDYKNSTVIGWNGINGMAQAHATLLFHRMLEHGLPLDRALSETILPDPSGASAIYRSPIKNQQLKNKPLRTFVDRGGVDITFPKKNEIRFTSFFSSNSVEIKGKISGYIFNGERPQKYKLYLVPIGYQGESDNLIIKDIRVNSSFEFSQKISLPHHLINRAFEVRVLPADKENRNKDLKQLFPTYIVFSTGFKPNYAHAIKPAENNIDVSDEQGRRVENCELNVAAKTTFYLEDATPRNYQVKVENPSIATANINGLQLSIEGKKIGKTKVIVSNLLTQETSTIEIDIVDGSTNWTPLDKVYQYDGDDSYHRYHLFAADAYNQDKHKVITWEQFKSFGFGLWDSQEATVDYNFDGTGHKVKFDIYQEDGINYLLMYKGTQRQCAIRKYWVKDKTSGLQGIRIEAINVAHRKNMSLNDMQRLNWPAAKYRFFPASGMVRGYASENHSVFGKENLCLYWTGGYFSWAAEWNNTIINDTSNDGLFFRNNFIDETDFNYFGLLHKASVRYHY